MNPLAPGQRIDLPGGALSLSVTSRRLDLLATHVRCLLAAVDSAGRAPDDFAPIHSLTRELRAGASFADDHSATADLSALPTAVHRLIFVMFTAPASGFTFKDLGELTASAGPLRMPLDLVDRGETAIVLFDVYRRGGGWRLGANGQGFTGGLPAVSRALGLPLPSPMAPGRQRGSEPRPSPGERTSGSGFAVASRSVLTNHHVIEDARTVSVWGERGAIAAEVVFADPRNDIALLQLERDVEGLARFRDPEPPQLGEDVIVMGYPLQGLLGAGPQVSAGNVSALAGLGSDTGQLQFTAPIASGNSGGPILDASGLVIGLVRAALNHEHVRMGGGVAENVNFGVKGALVRAFLSAAGVEPRLAASTLPPSSRAEIAREGRRFLYRVDCTC